MHCFNSFSVVFLTLNKLVVSELAVDNISADNTYHSMENVSTSKLPQTVAALSAAGGSFALGTE